MAYLHCHNCGWSQDDFWEEDGYNPFCQNSMEWLKECLFKDKIHLDPSYFIDAEISPDGADEDGPFLNSQEFVAIELQRKAQNIRNMAVKTNKEWGLVKDTFHCPQCGSKNLDID